MSMYCSICGSELEPEDEEEGMCQSCKIARGGNVTTDELETDTH